MSAEKYVCPECGGDDLYAPADAHWSVEDQKWVLDDVVDDADDVCYDCEAEVRGTFVPADLKDLAKIAINESEKANDTDT